MTVTVRPVPQRVARNGIRPFRPVVPTNNLGPVTVKNWRPPVPEPLPPAPLLGPRALLGLGALVLAQIWGWLASRPKATYPQGGVTSVDVSGLVGADGGKVLIEVTGKQRLHTCYNPGPGSCYGGEIAANSATNFYKSYAAGAGGIQVTTEAGPSCGLSSVWVRTSKATQLPFQPSATMRGGSGSLCGDITQWQLKITYSDPIGTTTAPVVPIQPEPQLPPNYKPPTVPAIAPARVLPVTPASPTTTPAAPVPEPEQSPTPTTPGPAAPPTVAPPLVPKRTVPIPIREVQPTQDGVLVPQAPSPVAVTPPDAHFPVPGAPPVTGNGPRPTPEGIAQELGRLEQKLAKMLNPGPDGPGDGTDRQQLLEQRMRQIWEFLTSITAGGGYGLSSPCELDQNGERIVTTVEYGGGFNSLDVLSNKIDALAALLQVHKDLKQPICKQTPAVGQPVTVDFLQVD